MSYSYGVETGLPLAALNSHGVIVPLIIMSASRITMYSASVFTWLIQCTTAAGLLIAGYLKRRKRGSENSIDEDIKQNLERSRTVSVDESKNF